MTLSVRDIAWLAGLLEGEGCFSTRKKNNYIRIHVNLTDYDVIARAAEILRTKVQGPYQPKVPRKDGSPCKPVWRVCVYGPRAASWMMTLYSLLGERRREQIELALASWTPRRAPQGSRPTCHPERPLGGLGLCSRCYHRNYMRGRRIKDGLTPQNGATHVADV